MGRKDDRTAEAIACLVVAVIVGFATESLLWGVLTLVFLVAIVAAYRAGKQEGSRKGYGVGYDRGRRSSGCAIVVLVSGAVLASIATALPFFVR